MLRCSADNSQLRGSVAVELESWVWIVEEMNKLDMKSSTRSTNIATSNGTLRVIMRLCNSAAAQPTD